MSLAALYARVHSENHRIIRSRQEILAIRSGKESCPTAIKDINILIKGGNNANPRERVCAPRPSKMSDKPSKGLMSSCWATDELGESSTVNADQFGSLRV
ncbi:hypothetical protein F4802DRAFT_546564, partial [Xylaria palmicola]